MCDTISLIDYIIISICSSFFLEVSKYQLNFIKEIDIYSAI